jgi:hypothetical protein
MVVGEAGIEVAERIVEECGRCKAASTPVKIGELDVARILEDCRQIADDAALLQRAALIEVAVKANHFLPSLGQHG